jgi:hypothetical protein
MEWVRLAQERDQWRALVSTELKCSVPYNADISWRALDLWLLKDFAAWSKLIVPWWNIRNPDAPDYVTLYIICFTPYSKPSGINQYLSRSTRDSCRVHLKRDGTRAETRFRLSVKRKSPFKSAGASVQSTTGSRGVRISSINAGYTMFRGSVKGTGYPLHSPFPLHFPYRASPCAITFQLESTPF